MIGDNRRCEAAKKEILIIVAKTVSFVIEVICKHLHTYLKGIDQSDDNAHIYIGIVLIRSAFTLKLTLRESFDALKPQHIR